MNKYSITLETLIRFVLGGLAVVGCYIISLLIPLKLVAGMFAAFPAIMVSSVALSGYRDGDNFAGEVAKGAVSGMIGCALCVLAAIGLTRLTGWWLAGVLLSIPVWFAGSIITGRIILFASRRKGMQS